MQKYKLLISVVSILLLLIFILSISAGRIITAAAKQLLEQTFTGSIVSIGKCQINFWHSLIFSDIEIKKGDTNDIRINEINISYSSPYINAAIDTLKIYGISFEEIRITGTLTGTTKNLSIKKITYNDAVIKNTQCIVRIDNNVLFLDSLTARLFNGSLSGSLKIALNKDKEFSLVLAGTGLNLDTVTRDFKLGDKFQMSGKLNGSLSVSGRGFNIMDIYGELSTDAPGGTLTVKDTKFLETMARKSKKTFNIVMENLKNYQYTIGIIKLSLDNSDLILNIALEGETGKRTFDVILHDIISEN